MTGSNFTSAACGDALHQLRIQHNTSSAYRPQSQGALERFHASVKSLLRAYCVELNRDWEEGLPWLLLAARSVVQESTGFSPNQLVFAHQVRCPLDVLKGDAEISNSPDNVVDYVHGFRRKLFLAWTMASDNLTEAQKQMKKRFDKKSKLRVFSPGDQVLALLPLPGSPFTAKFSGPYVIKRKVSETNYVVSTNRRRATQLCHVNLLKPYYTSLITHALGRVKAVALAGGGASSFQVTGEDDGIGPDDALLLGRLDNSAKLAELDIWMVIVLQY